MICRFYLGIPRVIDDKQLLREATDLISMGQEAGVRSRSGQVVTQKIDIKLVIIAEVIIEIQLGRGVTPERLL